MPPLSSCLATSTSRPGSGSSLWMRAHDLWLYETLYLESNQRVHTFFQPGRFIPFAESWAALHA